MMKNLRGKKLLLLTTCICSTLLNTAYAAETDLTNFDLAEYIVTATKTSLDAKKVPMSVEVVTAEDMKKLGAYNVRDALRTVNGLNVQEAGMTGNTVQIRGMGTNHTLILIDGKRMAGEDSGSTMNVYELTRINLQDVERIEIIRGAGSSLYGSDAMGGVINVITKKSTQQKGTIGTSVGSKENAAYFNYSSGSIGKASFKLNGNLTKVRQQTNEDTSTNMFGPKRYLDFSTDYKFDADHGLELSASYLKEQYTALDTANTEWYDNTRKGFALNYYGKDGKNDYNFRTYYNVLNKESRKRTTAAWSDFDRSEYKTWVVEGKNSAKLDANNTLTYGAEYKKLEAGGTRLGAGADDVYTDNYLGLSKVGSTKNINTKAAFIQDEWQVNDRLFIVPSIRYDSHSTFGGKVSPKLGATYNLSGNTRIKANYGKGYRAPSIFELYSQMDRVMGKMRVQVLGNPDLQPEESTSFDLAIEAEKGKSKGKLGYFHSDVTNLISSKTISSGYVPGVGMVIKSQYVNIDDAKLSGIEAEYQYNFDKNWQVKSTYTYLNAENKNTGDRLDNRAKQTGTLQLVYTNGAANPFTATLWNQWYIDYLYDTNNYTYSTTNIVFDKVINKNLRAYAGVDNIFNKTFTVDDDHTYSVDGRMWRLGLEMSF